MSGYSRECPMTLSNQHVIHWCWRSTRPAGKVFCKCAQLNFQRYRLFYWMTVMYNILLWKGVAIFLCWICTFRSSLSQSYLESIYFLEYVFFWKIVWCFLNCQAIRSKRLLLCRQTSTVILKYLRDHFCLQPYLSLVSLFFAPSMNIFKTRTRQIT